MKHTERCNQPGCTFVAEHANVSVARRVLGNHKRRQHGIVGASVSAQWKAKKEGLVGDARISERAPEPEPQVIPNFCPNCGCSIRTVMAAMNLRAKR